MASIEQAITTLREISTEAGYISQAAAVLSWDQETYMPPAAIEGRASQQAILSALVHQRLTSDDLGTALQTLGASDATPTGNPSLAFMDSRLVRQLYRTWKQARKIPEQFIRNLAMATSQGQVAWANARENNDFAGFQPHLEKIVDLCRQKAEYLGYQGEAYDALLDEYEPGMNTTNVEGTFAALAGELAPLVTNCVRQSKNSPIDTDFLSSGFSIEGQQQFAASVMEAMGFSSERGRLDVSAHPFSTSLGRDDVRITTNWSDDLSRGLYGVIHETGHALYELGLGRELPSALASGTSLGIHESQSRLWENMVGRSREFWQHFFGRLQTIFPAKLQGKTADDLYRAVNRVQLSQVRIHADELTYSLHIMLRFRLELALMRGQLQVADLPAAWNAQAKKLLGAEPANNREGCLQDIHWSMGAIGYFPTYALGNLYGAMFMDQAATEMPKLWDNIAHGQFEPLRSWLQTNIHQHGLAKNAGELLQDICGKPLSHQSYIGYLRGKYQAAGKD